MRFLVSLVIIPLMFFSFFNGVGLLFGFERVSDACKNFQNGTETNFEHYFFPITPYACKEDGGLLQPAAKEVFAWFSKRHNKPKPVKPRFKPGDCIAIDEHFLGQISEIHLDIGNGEYFVMFGSTAWCDTVDALNSYGAPHCSTSDYDIEYVDQHSELRKCRTNDEAEE